MKKELTLYQLETAKVDWVSDGTNLWFKYKDDKQDTGWISSFPTPALLELLNDNYSTSMHWRSRKLTEEELLDFFVGVL